MPDDITLRADGSMVADVGLATRLVIPEAGPISPMEDQADDGYPDIIVDQRRGYHALETESVDEIIDYWDRFLANHRPPKQIIETGLEVVPFINGGRWVADCECAGGMLCWDRNPTACCLSCGRRYSVRWQLPALRSEVIRTLACRPVSNQNWDPRLVDDLGEMVESVTFLQRENLLMLGKAY